MFKGKYDKLVLIYTTISVLMRPQESNKAMKDTGYSKSVAPGIVMPKGGGAMRGIDEKFSVNAVNGTSGMSIGIPMQKTRSDFAPGLTLGYNSGSGNSEFGLGWSLSLPGIQRKTDKRLPEYNDVAESDVFLFAGAEDLVPVIGDTLHPNPFIVNGTNDYTITRYIPRVEGLFARIERIQQSGQSYFYWRVTTKDNINTYFGLQASSRLSDPKDANRIYKWLPDMSFDDKGNVHVFEYKAEDLVNVPKALHEQHRHNGLQGITNLYLKRVYYGNKTPYSFGTASAYAPVLPQISDFLYTTVFDYGEHDTQNPTIYDDIPNDVSNTHRWSCRKDAFSDYHAGFEIRTYRLCKRVLSFSIFEELNPGATDSAKLTPHLIQSLDLTYKYETANELLETDYIIEATHWMYRKISGGYDKKKLPPMKFTYNEVNWDTSIHSISKENLVHAPTGLSGGYQWMDFYGEGISGILTEQAEGWYYKSNWGDGSFSPAQKIAPKPNFSGLQLQDLEANGKKYAVSNTIGTQGYFELDDDDKWQNFRAFKHIPNIDYNDANTRMLDLNGDGMPDMLITQERVFTYYEAKGIEGYGQAKTTTHPLDENKGPSVVFADSKQSIFLADMSGDGMVDIVRIRNKDICYWPNLGYGKFGAKVTMSHAPLMDRPDQFNPAYIHLSDISGTGASDIIYLGKNKFRAWLNQSGNGWSDVQEITPFPQSELPNTLSVLDLLGNGTSCLVWSSPLPQYSNSPMRYIDLMGGNKPYLMKQYDNSAGKQVSLTYKSSTHYYLEDKKKGTPWITKLPFPVHCVQKTETKDLIAGTTYGNLYSYHHGYYDHAEREFRGFGRVETLDTETFVNPNAQGTLDEPPVLTKTWYHTGAWLRKDKILNHYKDEYFKPTGSFTELDLVQPTLPGNWTAIEQREALRALKGVPLRQEVYAKDASDKEHLPYSATEYNYDIQLLQGKSNNRFAVFLVHEKENIGYHYERNESDPRIAHSLNILIDKYANVLESASVVYGRVGTVSDLPDEADQTVIDTAQRKRHIVYTVNEYTKFIILVGNTTTEIDDLDTEKDYRLRLPWRVRQYELTKVVPTGATLSTTDKYFKASDLQSNFASADEIDYSVTASTTVIQKRLIEAQYSLFYDDTASAPLAEHIIASRAILYESYRLAFTEDLLAQVYDTKVPASSTKLSTDGRYIEKTYMLGTASKKQYWIPSGTISYTSDNYTGTSITVDAATNFYLPMSFTDPFGYTTHLKYYTAYHFLLEGTKDALHNETRVLAWEWRTMQVQKIEDINGNHNIVAYDILGLPVGMAVLGKGNDHTDTEADSLLNFTPDLTAQQVSDFFNAPVTNAPALLAHATTRFIYDYENYLNNQSPLRVATITREIHDKDVTTNNPLKLQLAFEYSDGLGRVLMKKVQAEPGLYYVSGNANPVDSGTALRWVGTGRTILNNKGKPIKQYEPYFSGTPHYESDSQLVQVGYSPVLYYDAVGRLIRTDMPDGTYSKVEFDAWMQKSYDANDNVSDSKWKADRETGGDLVNIAEEVDAKDKTLSHADTPSVVHTDSLARPFYTIQHNKKLEESTTNPGTYVWVEEFLFSYVVMDIESNTKEVYDARGNVQLSYYQDMLGNVIYQNSIDGAERWMLNDVFGKPIYGWDSMNQVARNTYDVLHRPTAGYIQEGSSAERKISSIAYGENQTDDKLKNLRGKPIMSRDGGGESKMLLYDFKGQALQSSLQILDDATIIDVDWVNNPPTLNSTVYTTLMVYDALGRPKKHTDPGQNETRHIYNEAGLLNEVWMKPNGASDKQYVSNIDYNAKGQRDAIWYGNGSKTKYEYNPKNYRLTRLKTTRINSSNQLITFQDLNYYYDAVGNITTLRDDAQDTIYFNNAAITATQKYTYDALYRLIKSEGREMFNGKDEVNNNAFTPFSQTFPANNANALLGYKQYYEYDGVGNILKLDHNAGGNSFTRLYNYDDGNNRLVSTQIGSSGTPITYGYDAHGNMTDMPHLHKMQWNALDQLSVVAATTTTADKTYYQYSGGQRIRKYSIRGSNVEERIYLGNYEVYRTFTSGTLKVKRETVHVSDDTGRIAMYENRLSGNSGDDNNTDTTLIRYIYSNHLQSSSLELSDGGEIISYEEYHSYGTTSYHAASSTIKATAKRYRYTGKERDTESGLYYHGARYYIPWLARWTAVDPLESKYAGLSSYNYSFNNPVMFNDPNGMGPSGSWYRDKENKLHFIDGIISEDAFKNSQYKDKGTWAFESQNTESDDLKYHIFYSGDGSITTTNNETGEKRKRDFKGKETVLDNGKQPVVKKETNSIEDKSTAEGSKQIKPNKPEPKPVDKNKETSSNTDTDKIADSASKVSNSIGLVTSSFGATFKRGAYLAKINKTPVKLWVPTKLNWDRAMHVRGGGTKLFRLGTMNPKSVIRINKVLQPLGKLASGVSIATSIYNIQKDGKLTAGDAFEATVTAVGLLNPAFGLLYGAVDLAFSFFSEKSLTDRIRESIDSQIKIQYNFTK